MESRFRTGSAKIALFSVLVAVTVLTNLILVPMPPPLQQYDLSPVMICAVGVLVSPGLAGLIIAVAQGIGVGYKALTLGFPLVFVPGAMLVRGAEAIRISLPVAIAVVAAVRRSLGVQRLM